MVYVTEITVAPASPVLSYHKPKLAKDTEFMQAKPYPTGINVLVVATLYALTHA
jgi:hypothetical protein